MFAVIELHTSAVLNDIQCSSVSARFAHLRSWDADVFCISELETKNIWARDDPAILILISACLVGRLTDKTCQDALLRLETGSFRTSVVICSLVPTTSHTEVCLVDDLPGLFGGRRRDRNLSLVSVFWSEPLSVV